MPTPVPIRLEGALLRALLPELALREGMVMAARVLERSGTRGTLSMAGRQLAAELPAQLAAGDELRLRVDELGEDRVVLRVVEQPAPPAPAAPPPLLAVPLPGGAHARLAVEADEEEARRRGPAAPPSVTVRYASPALGAMDLRLTLEEDVLRAVVEVGTAALEAAQDGAGRLRDALTEASARPADVRISERRDPVDVYA